jgi:ABC-type dipeptide/oligopeptide/nickel transport system permease component
LILLFAVTLGWLRSTGQDTPRNLDLLAITVGPFGMGVFARQSQSAVLGVPNEDYVRTARSKDLAGRAVVVRRPLWTTRLSLTKVAGLLLGADYWRRPRRSRECSDGLTQTFRHVGIA